MIVGLILYMLGQGPVKGFAITLIIGIICSFFSAVFITRVVIEWFSKKGDQSNISFANKISMNSLNHFHFDFLSKRKMAYIFSGSFMSVGVLAIIFNGLSMGVDFKGGRSYIVSFDQAMETSALKTQLTEDFNGQGTEVKTFGSNKIVKITTSYLTDDDTDLADKRVKATLIAGLESATGQTYIANDAAVDANHFSIGSSSKVGATIADDIKNSSYKSAMIALICIFLYILIRFRKWQFGIGAIVALLHDALFVISSFAIANLLGISFEVDQVFVAAILTIIGYSINDTVVCLLYTSPSPRD